MTRPLRYGTVPYLNAAPLLDGLEEETGPLVRAVPALLARLLVAGEVDVALAPVVAAFSLPGAVVVPAGAVVARGPVRSVLLFSRAAPQAARTVGLDTSSRTSAALVRVLYAHLWHATPRFVPRDPDPDLLHLAEDAALLIGDPALRAVWDGPEPLDLGAVWIDWTGLPFVFATWIARDEATAARAVGPLSRAAERGRADVAQFAAEGAARVGLTRAQAETYLRDHLSFHFGPDEAAGLARFRELCAQTPGIVGNGDLDCAVRAVE